MIENGEFLAVADKMAAVWVERGTDPNEVAKALTYLRGHPDGPGFFRYLRTVQEHGGAVVRSGRTLQYYYAIQEVCRHYLRDYQDDPQQMALILGWAARLMRYHKVAPRLKPPPSPEAISAPSPHDILAQPKSIKDLQVGMTLRGTVRTIKPYGAFVDIGVGRDGLVHISELSEGWVNRVEDVVSKGDSVIVWVKDVDRAKNRIGLSMKKQPTEDTTRSKKGR
jgi:hypothetical protein